MTTQMTAAAPMAASEAIRNDRAVGLWLLGIAGLIGLMVVVGGLTRLTGSGLSITEWHPLTGAFPPLSNADWQAEFDKYRGTSQYELINKGMGLAGFKAIYWWEWSHRFLGRVLGLALFFPLVYFAYRRRIDRPLVVRLAVIVVLIGLQGLLGWWMVQSGLQPRRVVVSQYMLAAHLGAAIVLFGYILWTVFEVMGTRRTANAAVAARFHSWAVVLAGLIFVQMILGAFMAGLDAGIAFPTWPTYSGAWIPPGLYGLSPWWLNHFENPAMVHFQHRNVGYVVAVLAVWLYVAMRRAGADRPARIAGIHVVLVTALQVMLGIVTVLSFVSLPVAALHQICALGLFGTALWLVYALGVSPSLPEPDRR